MPYQGDEFFPDADEREALNGHAADAVSALVAIRRVAYFLGFDAIGDACLEAERVEASDQGVDLDDIDEVIALAESLTLHEAAAAGELVRACEREEKRREAVRARAAMRRAA